MSRKKSRMQSLREAKDKRAKRMAIGGAVLLGILLAWEVPHVLGGHKAAAPAATTTAVGTAGSTTPTSTTAAGTAAAAVAPTSMTTTKLRN